MNRGIIERLDRIEKKIDGTYKNRYLSVKDVQYLTTCSISKIRRAIARGELKCSKRLGKLLFTESSVRRWVDG